jgi:hypothetical protein
VDWKEFFKATWITVILLLVFYIIIYFGIFDWLFPIFDSQFWGKGPFPIQIWIPMKLGKIAVSFGLAYFFACLVVYFFKSKKIEPARLLWIFRLRRTLH